MKKLLLLFFLFSFSISCIANFLFPKVTKAEIINMNGKCEIVTLNLQAGTYEVRPVGSEEGGIYDSFSPWSFTTCNDPNGCLRTFPSTVTGWVNQYGVQSQNIVSVFVEGENLEPVASVPEPPPYESFFLNTEEVTYYIVRDGMVYPDGYPVLENAQTSIFTLDTDGIVAFWATRWNCEDNRGGVSLEVTNVEMIDSDGDGIPDVLDNCPDTFNSDQADLDGDGVGDACDDDADGDNFIDGIDCNDFDPFINPDACDIKHDGIDQDCDGQDRTTGIPCGIERNCSDGVDNDKDGLIDCEDLDCLDKKFCK